MPLPNEMHCICGFSTANGNNMARHLNNCGQKSAYSSLQMAQENTVKRNMLDMLGLVKRDGEQSSSEVADAAAAAAVGDTSAIDQDLEEAAGMDTDSHEQQLQQHHQHEQTHEQQQQHDMQQQQHLHHQQQQGLDMAGVQDDDVAAAQQHMDAQSMDDGQPIPFGQMDATPVEQQQQPYSHIVVDSTSHLHPPQNQYHMGFGQTEVAPHTLNAADIDMPLIGELADPNPPPTPQFIGEVHTPMFDAVAAAEQQHYHQMMQQQQQQQQQMHPHIHHHHQQ